MGGVLGRQPRGRKTVESVPGQAGWKDRACPSCRHSRLLLSPGHQWSSHLVWLSPTKYVYLVSCGRGEKGGQEGHQGGRSLSRPLGTQNKGGCRRWGASSVPTAGYGVDGFWQGGRQGRSQRAQREEVGVEGWLSVSVRGRVGGCWQVWTGGGPALNLCLRPSTSRLLSEESPGTEGSWRWGPAAAVETRRGLEAVVAAHTDGPPRGDPRHAATSPHPQDYIICW